MDIMKAQELALFHMKKHLQPEWGFQLRWDQSTDRAGACYYNERVIVLSEVAVRQYNILDVEQIIFHEIAHAQTGPGHGHGKLWKEKAAALGYTGDKYAPRNIAATGTGLLRLWVILALIVLVFFWNPIGWIALVAAAVLGVVLLINELRPASSRHEVIDFVEAQA